MEHDDIRIAAREDEYLARQAEKNRPAPEKPEGTYVPQSDEAGRPLTDSEKLEWLHKERTKKEVGEEVVSIAAAAARRMNDAPMFPEFTPDSLVSHPDIKVLEPGEEVPPEMIPEFEPVPMGLNDEIPAANTHEDWRLKRMDRLKNSSKPDAGKAA